MKKYDIKKDPEASQEAEKYDNPIPSRTLILQYLNDLDYPASLDYVANGLSMYQNSEIKALSNRLNAMVRDEQLINHGGYFCPVDYQDDLVTGQVQIQQDGQTLVKPHNTQIPALILPGYQAKAVFHGDEVTVRICGLNRKEKLDAKIESILTRHTQEIVGYYQTALDGHFIQPISKKITQSIALLPPRQTIEPNTMVRAKIISQPNFSMPAISKFVETIQEQSPVFEAISIASKRHDLIETWRDETQQQIDQLPDSVTETDLQNRTDLRHLPFITIDGADAKDFDDAVYAHRSTSGGWKVYVAIADVSYYVRPDSALDQEAFQRSTSVYFPGYVIPMLPEKLSNELCSLKPNQDRLALICEMNVSRNGRLSRYQFYSGVIHSHARLTYTQVGNYLTGDTQALGIDIKSVKKNIDHLYGLYQCLHEQRAARGAIDFDTVDTQIVLNESNHIDTIQPQQRNDAHRLIEECMLLANVATARFIQKNKVTAPFRIHQAPSFDQINELKAYIRPLGLELPIQGNEVKPGELAAMLEQAKGRDDFHNIQLVTLKSMNQAVYSPDNIGHFGLAYSAYTHFTSPIRRYPDLVIHRALKAIIGEKTLGGHQYPSQQLKSICDHASTQERNADSASKEVESWLKCHFLKPLVGQTMNARVTHVTGFGVFAELTDYYVEGLIHITSLTGDYFIFDSAQHRLVGKNTGKVYSIGQLVEIQLVRVDPENGHIDFALAGQAPNTRPSKDKKRRQNKSGKKAPAHKKPDASKATDDAEDPSLAAKRKKKRLQKKRKTKKKSDHPTN